MLSIARTAIQCRRFRGIVNKPQPMEDGMFSMKPLTFFRHIRSRLLMKM